MKRIVLILGLLFSTQLAFTQAPEKINYQAVARDASGNPLVNQTLNVTYQIRQSSPTGTSVYTETHSGISTNQFGLFTAEVGGGTPSVGTFAGINWGAGLYYLYVEVNGDPMGSSQLLSVPYALHAKTATSGVPGADGYNSLIDTLAAGSSCPNGGYQVLIGLDSNANGTLESIEISKTFVICNGIDGTSGTTYFTGNGISLSGDTITNLGDADADPSNELQDLSLTGNSLSLTNDPTPVDLTPYLDNTDAQTLSINANTLAISNGNSVTLPTAPTYTAGTGINLTGNVITNTAPDQTVALNNGTGINVTGTYPNFTINNTSPASGINITGGGITSVSGTSPNFTISTPAQTLTYTAPNLTLSNGGGTVTIPPSPWGKTGSTIHELTAGDNVGIGITTAEGSLHIRSTNNQIKLGHPNQPTAEWTYGVNASGLLSVINENYGTPITAMSMTNLGLVGIGTTTPTANLHLNGTLRLNNLGGPTPAVGSVLTSIDAQGNAEWQPPTTTTTYWSPNGTDIYNNNSGNVGIGTTAPNVNGATKALTIAASNSYVANKVASLELQGSHNGSNVEIGKIDFNSIGGSISNHARISSVNGGGSIGTSGRLLFHTANGGVLTEQVRITETGKVGIGTTTPVGRFDVVTSTDLRGSQIQNSFTSNSDKYGIYANASGGGSGDNIGGWFESFGSPTGISYGVAGQSLAGGSENRAVYGNATGATTNWAGYFGAGNVYMQNNLGIGTTTISGTSYKVRVEASEMINGFYVQNTTSSNIAYANRGRISHTGTSAGYAIHGHAFGTGTGSKYGVYGTAYSTGTETKYGIYGTTISGGTGTRYAGYFSGDVHISGTLTNPSDRKLKTNISQVNFNAINLLKSLNIYEYQYKTDKNFKSMNLPSGTQVGFMADELKSLFPSLVKKEKIDLNATPDSDSASKIMEYDAVNYIGMTPILIKAIQEQQKMIEELQKEIKELKENK